ncbi:hypothetical protein BC361_08590 [Ensifer sp. LC54]|nr:hypothetical protein BC361_08590 [Ensifer sp. LC54]
MRQSQPMGAIEGRRIDRLDIGLDPDIRQGGGSRAHHRVMQIADPFIMQIGQIMRSIEHGEVEFAGTEIPVHLVGVIGLHVDLGCR